MMDDDFAKQLGTRIRELRKIKGVSQLILAYDMDMSMNTISGIELGKISPKIETINKIANRLEINIAEIFDFSAPVKDKVVRKRIEQISRKLRPYNKEFLDLVDGSIDILIQAQNTKKEYAPIVKVPNIKKDYSDNEILPA